MLDLKEKIGELIQAKNVAEIRELAGTLYPAETAELLESLSLQEKILFFRFLGKDSAAEVFSYLSLDEQRELVEDMKDSDLNSLIHNLETDDAVSILDELPANAVRRILSIVPAEKRHEINRFLQYPEESCGSIMTTKMILLKEDMTVGEALKYIRRERRQLETLLTCFIRTKTGELTGVIHLDELLDNDDEKLLSELEQKHPVSVFTDSDQETALNLMKDLGLLVIPVVDKENRVVGAITIDDMLAISQAEATEDFEIMAAMSPSDDTYLETSVWQHTKRRFPWLLLLMLTGMINGLILGSFEHAFVAIPLLVTFVPMLTDTGGNAGSQSSTLIIRGLATGELSTKDLFTIIKKELRISFIIGLGLGLISFIRVYFFNSAGLPISLVVGLSVTGILVLAKLCGSLFPVIAKKLGLDPALMASPLITTVVDALGLTLFFTLAKAILKV